MVPRKANALREQGESTKRRNQQHNYKHSQSLRPDFAYYESLKRLITQRLSPAEYDNAILQAARKAGI